MTAVADPDLTALAERLLRDNDRLKAENQQLRQCVNGVRELISWWADRDTPPLPPPIPGATP